MAHFFGFALGLACLFAALLADPQWTERHFLPVWSWSWQSQLRLVAILRWLLVAVGLVLVFVVRPRWARAWAQRSAGSVVASSLRMLLAVLAALLVSELVLRTRTWRAAQERWDLEEPLRLRDREYGWSFAADHAGTVKLDGRVVHYATGPYGYRAPQAGVGPDFARPTIVFAGESIVFGYGLDWPETIAARVRAQTGIQTVNIAVNAHATDQIYLRLRRELPRFAHPVAVVIPFMPRLLDRNLDTDKPHLDTALRWHPADRPPIRLVELTRRVLRYRSPGAIARGEAQTSAVLKGAIALARARGAKPIVLVPQYLPEAPVERDIRARVLDRAGIAYILVPIPPAWRSPTHYHPTAAGTRAIAERIERELGRSGGG